MAAQRVLADDGPVGGRLDLHVELDQNGEPPKSARWTWEGKSHLYRLIEDERAISSPEYLYLYAYVGPVEDA